jgi:hypothetical protein
MPIERMINPQPHRQPHKSQQAGGSECPSPSHRQCDQWNGQRRDCPAYAGAAVEDGHRKTSLFTGEPFRNHFGCSGPIKAFADAQHETKKCKTENGAGKSSKDIHHRPPDRRNCQADAAAHRIQNDAAHQPCDGIGDLKGSEDFRQVRVRQMVLRRNHRRQHREALTADVVGDGRKEERPDNPPARSPRAFSGPGWYNSGLRVLQSSPQ